MFHQSWPRLRVVSLVGFILLFPIQSVASSPNADDWPLYSHDYNNSNYNASENKISSDNAMYLRRAWETFNDDSMINVPPPNGFILESALGLVFPNAVVGVVASPILRDGTLYYVDALGTVFARDARTGKVIDPTKHWTTSLVDPDFENTTTPVLPELVYTAPIVTDSYVWVLGSAYGQLHLLDRSNGAEIDFNASTPEIDPYRLVPDLPFSSILGDAVIIDSDKRQLLIASINVILNDALVQGEEGGLQIALDISDPAQPIEVWRRSTLEVDPTSGLRFGSGVSAGSGLAVDFKRKLIFGGTGQNTGSPYPDYPNPLLAPLGYIDRSDSLYAIDFDSGEFVWTNQFFNGDVFNLNAPVSTGPNRSDGPRDADVLSPPVLFSAKIAGKMRDLVGNGSKGGLFKVVDRDNGNTVWERQISKATGIGGIQAGAAVAGDVIYVAGFEGIDDGFSDAQFGISLETGLYPNAFFATFSPAFWADVEDVADDGNPATGMRVKVYALDSASGESKWRFSNNEDFVNLSAGAALRHVSVANDLLYITTSSGQLFVLDVSNGKTLFHDQSIDLNEFFSLGLSKPHHAGMNAGSIISQGMVYVPYGAQNNPSGGLIAYEVNEKPVARQDQAKIWRIETTRIDALQNDVDPDGDKLRFSQVAGVAIDPNKDKANAISLPFGQILVVNPGDDPSDVHAAYLLFTPNDYFLHSEKIDYQITDIAPAKIVNGIEINQVEPTHTPRTDGATITLTKMW